MAATLTRAMSKHAAEMPASLETNRAIALASPNVEYATDEQLETWLHFTNKEPGLHQVNAVNQRREARNG